MTLDELNHAAEAHATAALLACCGSEQWAKRMTGMRPFVDSTMLHESAESIWQSLEPGDWLEAFSKHPKIGEKSNSEWSAQEQQGMSAASSSGSDEMRESNEQYQRLFGWIFIVSATGKSAAEMRTAMKQRLTNDPETELQIAAAEQGRIMHLRIDKLLAE